MWQRKLSYKTGRRLTINAQTIFGFSSYYHHVCLVCSEALPLSSAVTTCVCAHLWVDEADGGFGPDVLLVPGGGRSVEAQHSFMRVWKTRKLIRLRRSESLWFAEVTRFLFINQEHTHTHTLLIQQIFNLKDDDKVSYYIKSWLQQEHWVNLKQSEVT